MGSEGCYQIAIGVLRAEMNKIRSLLRANYAVFSNLEMIRECGRRLSAWYFNRHALDETEEKDEQQKERGQLE